MSNYVKAVDFQAKDALASGNPLKIIQGVEINDEFNAIQTAVATKADLSSPALLGNPTAPTQDISNNSTRLATTAFVKAALALLHPVGSIYTSVIATNPATLFGFGTWVAFATGKTVIGIDTSDTSFDVVKETGGSKNAIVVAHTHTGTTDAGGVHNHFALKNQYPSSGDVNSYRGLHDNTAAFQVPTSLAPDIARTSDSGSHTHTITTASSGSTGTNANLPPYIVVYMWERTA
jgi:hypothetical protein